MTEKIRKNPIDVLRVTRDLDIEIKIRSSELNVQTLEEITSLFLETLSGSGVVATEKETSIKVQTSKTLRTLRILLKPSVL